MPDWFVFFALVGLVGGLVYAAQLIAAAVLGVGVFIADRVRPRPRKVPDRVAL